jgi:hypothetical protein
MFDEASVRETLNERLVYRVQSSWVYKNNSGSFKNTMQVKV